MGKIFEAILILSGMIIGVGMFGIPFSFAKTGFLIGGLELFILTGIIMLLHMLYADIIIATPTTHRLPGYVSLHLGKTWGRIAGSFSVFGIGGTLLAYIVIGSAFLYEIMQFIIPGTANFFWAFILASGAGILSLFPLKKEAAINGLLTIGLLGLLLFLTLALIPHIETSNLTTFHPENFFFPYGILIFALSGTAAIPDVVALLRQQRKSSRISITIGSLIPAALYFFFALSVVGSSGTNVSPEAIRGLRVLFGEKIVILGSAIGFLAVATSYFTLARNFKEMMELDFSMPKFLAWTAAIWGPLFLYSIGVDDFLKIIGIVGTISGGAEAAFLIATYHIIKRKETIPSRASYAWKIGLFLMFAAGVAYEIIYSL